MKASRRNSPLQSVLALVFIPTIWPFAFIAVAILFPEAIDPLLGGVQYILYVFALIWLVIVFSVTVFAAYVFRLRKTNTLFLKVAVFGSLIFAIGVEVLDLINRLQSIGSPGAIKPDSIDDVLNTQTFISAAQFVSSIAVVSLITALAFVYAGGLWLWRGKSTNVD